MKIILEFNVPEKAEAVDLEDLGNLFHDMIFLEHSNRKAALEKSKTHLTTEEIASCEKYVRILHTMLDPHCGTLTLTD